MLNTLSYLIGITVTGICLFLLNCVAIAALVVLS